MNKIGDRISSFAKRSTFFLHRKGAKGGAAAGGFHAALRSVVRVWHYELSDLLHDEGIMIFVFFVPLFYPLLYSWVYTGEVVREVPAVVVDECHTALSREFLRRVDASPDVRLVARAPSMDEARRWVMNHEAYGIYQVPANFERDLLNRDQTAVGVFCDMSSMLYYKGLYLAATEVALDMGADVRAGRLSPSSRRDEEIVRQPVGYDHVRLYNPSSGFASFLIPPVLMLILQQTLLLGIGMQMGRTRERKTFSSRLFFRSLPHQEGQERKPAVSATAIVWGKTLLYLGIYLVMGIYAFVCVNRWFSLPVLGNYGVFLAFLVPYLLACIFFAITLSSLVYRREDCILIFVFLSVPLLFMSGLSWPASAMPKFWKLLSIFFPSTFGMNAYVRITTMGCSLADVRAEWGALWCQAAVYFITATLMYRRQMRPLRRC